MSEELVKLLAEVLQRASEVAYPRDVVAPVPSGMGPERWRDVARECLRQMEWARRRCTPWQKTEPIEVDSRYPDMRGVRVVGENPITLAPPDWEALDPFHRL